MKNLPSVLSEWIQENGWDDIVDSGDMTAEANANLHRLFLSADEARSVSLLDMRNFIDMYIEIKRNQVQDKSSKAMTLYVWHDEISGSLCMSCISRSHLPRMPFACRLNTKVPLDEIVSGFLKSKYLDGIPASELQVIDFEQDRSLEESPSEFVLPVHLVMLSEYSNGRQRGSVGDA